MLNAFTNSTEYIEMLKTLTDAAFNELSVKVQEDFNLSIDDDTLDIVELMHAQSFIKDEQQRRAGINDSIGFKFNRIGV